MDDADRGLRSASQAHAPVVERSGSTRRALVAQRVDERLSIPEKRVLRLVGARVASPVEAPSGKLAAAEDRLSLPAPTDHAGAGPALPNPPNGERAGKLPDAFVSAVVAAMVTVTLVDGPASEGELRAVQRALAELTGTAVGIDLIETLLRAQDAGHLGGAVGRLERVEGSLSAAEKCIVLEMLFRVAAAGGWKLGKERSVLQLARALAVPREVLRALLEHEQLFLT